MFIISWLLACSTEERIKEEVIWSATVDDLALASLRLPSATWPASDASPVSCVDSAAQQSPSCRLGSLYQCARSDVMRGYIGSHVEFGYVPLWLQTRDGAPERCAEVARSASATTIRETVVARTSTSAVSLHARVEIGQQTSECAVRWGNARLPDRLVFIGLDLVLACAMKKLTSADPANERFEDLVRSLDRSCRLVGLEHEYKHGEISRVDVLYAVLADELELHRWWTIVKQQGGP
jgi:hypothetical protein